MNFVLFCITTFIVFYLCTPTQAQSDPWPKLLADNETCMEARNSYWARNPDVFAAFLDPVYHYQNGGYRENRSWTGTLCNTMNPIWANDSVCNCSHAQTNFTSHYTWLHQTNEDAFAYWLVNTKLHSNGGIVWRCDICMQEAGIDLLTTTASTTSITGPGVGTTTGSTTGPVRIVTVPENCTCWQAQMVFWHEATDAYGNDVDPLYYFETQGANQGRLWPCGACDVNPISLFDPSVNCTAAAEQYILINETVTIGVTLENAWSTWKANSVAGSIYPWHAELCVPLLKEILQKGPPNSTTSVMSTSTFAPGTATTKGSTTTGSPQVTTQTLSGGESRGSTSSGNALICSVALLLVAVALLIW